MDRIDTLVVGAGVIGLAIARRLAQAGDEVVVLEAATAHGTGTSSRNSCVIHAGLYYPTGSRKAAWCVRGKALLYEFCARRAVPHRRLGKLIVAAAAEAGKLEAIRASARDAGVDDLQWLDGAQARALEPALSCDAALLSPSTGIVDAHALMDALAGEAEDAGAAIALDSRFARAEPLPGGGWRVTAEVGDAAEPVTVECRRLINAAGLGATRVARAIEGLAPGFAPAQRYAKGNYAALSGRNPFSRLIYPVPVPGGLGTHLTIDLGGQANFGPDVQWLPDEDEPAASASASAATPTAASTGASAQAAARLRRVPATRAFDYAVDPARIAAFERDVRRWWPALPPDSLRTGYSGVRPKLVGPGEPAADFRVDGPQAHGLPGLVNLLGMESPGLTSCLAIAEAVEAMLLAGD